MTFLVGVWLRKLSPAVKAKLNETSGGFYCFIIYVYVRQAGEIWGKLLNQ